MLVLSRMKGQQIIVSGTITVTVLEVRGDKVKLGFEGPAEIPIHRQEVFQRLTDPLSSDRSTQSERSLAPSLA